jgi:hypothetical protein
MSTSPRTSWIARLAVIGVSLLLYIVACAAPAVYFDSESHPSWPGLMTLILGLFALLEGQLAWLANPVYAVALLLPLFRQWMATVVLAVVAFLIALLSFTIVGTTVPLDEASVNKAIATGLGPGYFAWLASMLVLAAGALALKLYESRRPA